MSSLFGSVGGNLRTFASSGGMVSTGSGGGSRSGTVKAGGANKKKTKKLRYNSKEVSNRIIRSKTSESAGRTVILARNKLASLRRKMGTGEYDAKELDNAIIHAMRMLRIAKKKQKHLRQEEQIAREGNAAPLAPQEELSEELTSEDLMAGGEELDREEFQRIQREMERLMKESMETMDSLSDSMQELSEEMFACWEDMSPEDLELLKKKRRADEMRQIIEADMQYLKAMFEQMERERSTPGIGVSLELRGVVMPVAAVEAPVAASGECVDVSL